VGQQVQVGDWLVTINRATLHAGGEFDTPDPGNTYLVLNVTAQNTAADAQALSSWDFTVRDATGQGYNERFTSFIQASPGGTVEPGGLTRGEMAYEVPRSVHQFTVMFEPELLSTMQATWDINV
jgi:hypothetical protein